MNLDAMSVDEIWQLHEEISGILSLRLTAEKRELEKRLAQLRREQEVPQSEPADKPSLTKALGVRPKYPRYFQNT